MNLQQKHLKYLIAKRIKRFSGVEIVNYCIDIVVNTLFCNFSNFKEIRDQISNLQLCDTTSVGRVE